MVMSAGQRTYLLNRSGGKNDHNNNLDGLTSDEFQSDVGKEQKNMAHDYPNYPESAEQVEEEPVIRKKMKSKIKRVKSKKPRQQVSTLESRLKNLSMKLNEGTNSSS